jgi:hypothetical protein
LTFLHFSITGFGAILVRHFEFGGSQENPTLFPSKPLSLAVNLHQPQRNWMPFPRPSWLLSRSAPNGGSSWIYQKIYLEVASVEFKVSLYRKHVPKMVLGCFLGEQKPQLSTDH